MLLLKDLALKFVHLFPFLRYQIYRVQSPSLVKSTGVVQHNKTCKHKINLEASFVIVRQSLSLHISTAHQVPLVMIVNLSRTTLVLLVIDWVRIYSVRFLASTSNFIIITAFLQFNFGFKTKIKVWRHKYFCIVF